MRIDAVLLTPSLVAALTTIVRNAVCYREAIALDEAGNTQGACVFFHALDGYNDTTQRMQALVEVDPVLPYRSVSKGDTVSFSSYEQNGNTSNGPESITWIVLDKIGDRLLFLSTDALETRQYHHVPFEEVTWENSDLRAWMNGDFYDGMFIPAQHGLIGTMHNENTDQSITGASGGAATDDRVSALSETESVICLNTPVARSDIGATPASVHTAAGLLSVSEDDTADQWLRSSGTYGFVTQSVDAMGVPSLSGVNVDLQHGMRPVLWINVEGVDEGGRWVACCPCVVLSS